MTTHPETTTRIRWQADRLGGFTGSVGMLKPWVFHVWRSPRDRGEWILAARLPGTRRHFGGDPDELKAEAEHWLEEFVSSLGAVFGDAVAADLRSRADELEAMVGRTPGQERDSHLFAAGLKRAADLIEHGDRPAVHSEAVAPSAPGGAGETTPDRTET